jgi:hypothetical protein
MTGIEMMMKSFVADKVVAGLPEQGETLSKQRKKRM